MKGKPIMDKYLLIQIAAGLLIGGSLGAVLGYVGKCSTGACPLTANPLRGSLYGAFLGVLFATTLGGNRRAAYAGDGAALRIASAEDFQVQVMDAEQPVLVDFYSPYCPPCHRLAPIVDKLAEDYKGRAVVVKVDVQKLPQVAQKFGVYGTPTVIILQNGQEVTRSVGLEQKQTYAAQLDQLLDV
jgi:thioredoxin 1